MATPRTKNGHGIHFPFLFQKHGRVGRVKKWKDKFGTYFRFAGKDHRSSFGSFERALQHLSDEFSKLDTDRTNSQTLFPLDGDAKMYRELEQLLRVRTNGATLREAVEFFLAHSETKRFHAKSVSDCIDEYLIYEKQSNVTAIHLATLTIHLRRFREEFGQRKIHSITTMEVTKWLVNCTSRTTGKPWSGKTRNNVRTSLICLSVFARDTLQAIPDAGKTQFQKVGAAIIDPNEVEIFSPDQLGTLLKAAVTHDIELIPAIVTGAFEGLRPDEFHAETARQEDQGDGKRTRRPLTWEAFNWNDGLLHVFGQKVRSKGTRDIPLHPVTRAWLEPFRDLSGEIWRYSRSYIDRMKALREKAEIPGIKDGFRHSYASYRIRELKGNLEELAAEMGNSPAQIIGHYKRNVTDDAAAIWFSLMPPKGYAEAVAKALALRQRA
jgi:integrase